MLLICPSSKHDFFLAAVTDFYFIVGWHVWHFPGSTTNARPCLFISLKNQEGSLAK
jgi:hypothetical protein